MDTKCTKRSRGRITKQNKPKVQQRHMDTDISESPIAETSLDHVWVDYCVTYSPILNCLASVGAAL